MTITDLITKVDIASWRANDVITITAGTGRGKSHFIKNTLYNHALEHNKNILFLVHRKDCYNQFNHELLLEHKVDIIDLKTYQSIEWNRSCLDRYDYIVSDESHYFLSDAIFNNTTEVSLEEIMRSKAIKIFMSATSNNINRFLREELKLSTIDYEIDIDYNFIDSITVYEDDLSIHSHIRDIINKGEKAIIFVQSAIKAMEIYKRYEDIALFNCSDSNPLSVHVDQEAIASMLKREKFDKQLLISTTSLDAGVNIIDESVKHVILDIKDIDSLIQCMGRKRIVNDERINVYIKHVSKYEAHGRINMAYKSLHRANFLLEYGDELYVEYYGRSYDRSQIVYVENDDLDGILMKVNKLMYHKQLNDIHEFSQIRSNGYVAYLSETFNLSNIIIAEQELINSDLKLYLESISNEYILTPEDRSELIEKINVRNNRSELLRGLNSLNSYLVESGIGYRIVQFRKTIAMDNGSKKRFNNIWKVVESDDR